MIGGLGRPLGKRLGSGGGGGYSAEAEAYFAAMTTQGGNAYKAAINTFISQLKSEGVWSSLDALFLFANKNDATDTVPSSWINMVSPSDTKAAKIGSPTYIEYAGWKGAASSAINLNQLLTNRAKYRLNSACVFAYVHTNLSNGYVACFGAYTGTVQQTSLMHSYDANGSMRISGLNSGGSDLTGITNNGVGMYAINRVNATTIDVYKDGNKLGTITANSNSIPTAPLYALASNLWNADTSTYNPNVAAANRVVSLVGFGEQMDVTKQAKLTEAFSTYMAAEK